MKKIGIMAITLILLLFVAACSGTGEVDAAGSTLLAIDINPSVEFVLDEEGNVLSVTASNEDAENVLSTLDLIGLPYEEALELFLNEVVELGYIDVTTTDNTVIFTMGCENEEKEAAMIMNAQAVAERFMNENKIGGAVINGNIAYEELNTLAEEYDISVGKVRLIQSAIAQDETLVFEDLVDLEMSELMNIVTTNHKDAMQDFIDNKKEAATQRREEAYNSVREKVQLHRQNVENNTAQTPNYDEIMENALMQRGINLEEYNQKSEAVRNNADKGQGNN